MEQIPAIGGDNLFHNVLALPEAAQPGLGELANLYLSAEVDAAGHPTFDAKQRDLQRFLSFYTGLYKHDRPQEWFASVTKAFLRHLETQGLAQASIVRIYATVRHFARWLHRKCERLFPLGCPTDGVKPPSEPTPDWQGLTRLEDLRLINAAQTLRARRTRGTNQALRNHALLAVLLGSGLRVSEVLSLDRSQYTGKGFTKVRVKGGHIRDVVPLHRDTRAVLEDYLEENREGPLFPTRAERPHLRSLLPLSSNRPWQCLRPGDSLKALS